MLKTTETLFDDQFRRLRCAWSHSSTIPVVRVATVAESTSADYLRQRRVFYRAYDTPAAALEALDSEKADAVVYDAALLKYLSSGEFANRMDVLPALLNVQEYAIALPRDSELRQRLNETLLRYRESDAWDDLIYRYLGE